MKMKDFSGETGIRRRLIWKRRRGEIRILQQYLLFEFAKFLSVKIGTAVRFWTEL